MPYLGVLAWSALFGAGGYFVGEVGETVEKSGNTAIKAAVVGAGVYFVLKKMKAI